jgi:hypothetical protein
MVIRFFMRKADTSEEDGITGEGVVTAVVERLVEGVSTRIELST